MSFSKYLKIIVLTLIVILISPDLFSKVISKSDVGLTFNCISSDSLTMPVQIYYFNYLVQQKSVLLKWGTATEVNNFGFEVQRSYNATSDWETIDFILGAGTSNVPIDYEYSDTTVICLGTVYYRLKQIDVAGSYEYSEIFAVNFFTDLELEQTDIPECFKVSENYPNPFNPSTKISFDIPATQNLNVDLYDINGKLVKEVLSGEILPGSYQLLFDFRDYSSGIYFVRFATSKNSIIKKLVLIK